MELFLIILAILLVIAQLVVTTRIINLHLTGKYSFKKAFLMNAITLVIAYSILGVIGIIVKLLGL